MVTIGVLKKQHLLTGVKHWSSYWLLEELAVGHQTNKKIVEEGEIPKKAP